ncbi:MAG: DUF1446 domain-containing protein [Parachlamydiaceae bacterium]|nr:DUF1446 domain-containing protein [Parachlamydiaceae bacterium]
MSYAAKPNVRIANTQGFWGDRPTATAQLLRQLPDLDYLTLDYLAEVSLSIMAIQREKQPEEGYAKDFVETLRSIAPFWLSGSRIKVITNAGGLNPFACAMACRTSLDDAGCQNIKIGVVDGDDVLPLLRKGQSDHFQNLDSHEPLELIKGRLMTANAYLGASPLVSLLKSGADVIITGRVADPSLTVAPCVAHFDWELTDYDKIAQATVAGHLLECGTQVTGGVSTDWLSKFISIQDVARMGFPFVEMCSDGTFIISKPPESGGRVDEKTVKEQLLYEIGDPSAYLSPDAEVSFLGIQLNDLGDNRVQISGARGKAPSSTYKVSATYTDGFKAEAMLAIFGSEASKKAKLCGEIILQRVADAGFVLERSHIECLGTGDVVGRVVSNGGEFSLECVLRVAVADSRREALECFVREIAPLVTSGPQGVTGYTSGRPHIRQVFGYWPCLIERSRVVPSVLTRMV